MEDQNMERENIVELYDENEQIVKFEHLMTLEHEGEKYALLVPLEGEDQDEVIILHIVEKPDGDDEYVGVEDEDLLNAIFEKYLALAEEAEDDE